MCKYDRRYITIMSDGLYNKSFVLYESVFRTYQRLYKMNKTIAADYIHAVMEFGIDDITPPDDDAVWMYGLDNAIAAIDSAKNRRKKNIEDGAKGGRRKLDIDNEKLLEMRNQGLSYDTIAKELGVSKSTIQRRFNSLVSNDVKIQNLNVNVNENVNIDDTKIETNEPKTGIDRINSLIG